MDDTLPPGENADTDAGDDVGDAYADTDAFLELLLISNMRLYDVMLNVFAEMAGEEKANLLRSYHMENKFFYPPVRYGDDDAPETT